jgi:PAS domain-containing protein
MNERQRAGGVANKSGRAALANSEERFRRLVDGIEDYAILMLDPQGLVTTWNKGAECIKGYRSDEIIGRNSSQFYPQEDVDHRCSRACRRESGGWGAWSIPRPGRQPLAPLLVPPKPDGIAAAKSRQ